ncbi:alpha-galactosidase [Rhodococcus opacus]|uniref:alpha-galactosidase n=1 Tax=Rhodococcus opacus TaxID=37919 RepID=UPI0034D34AEE
MDDAAASPELLGSHIASGISHTTGRYHRLSFRAGTALYGHLGIEWDLATATDDENAQLAVWIDLYKRHRELLHTGTMVRADEIDPTLLVYGAVAADRAEALFFLAYVGRSEVSPRGRFTLPGLDPDRRYRVRPVFAGAPDEGLKPPAWFDVQPPGGRADGLSAGSEVLGVSMTGRALAVVGLQTPASFPDDVVVLSVTAEA